MVGQVVFNLFPHFQVAVSNSNSSLHTPPSSVLLLHSFNLAFASFPSNVRSFQPASPSPVAPTPQLRTSVCGCNRKRNDITINTPGEEHDPHGGLYNHRR